MRRIAITPPNRLLVEVLVGAGGATVAPTVRESIATGVVVALVESAALALAAGEPGAVVVAGPVCPAAAVVAPFVAAAVVRVVAGAVV